MKTNIKIFSVLTLALIAAMPCFDAKAYDCDGISEKAVNCSINNETGKCSGDNLYFGRLKQQADIQFRQIIDKDILQSKNREKIQKAQKDKKTYVLSKVKEYCQELVTAGTNINSIVASDAEKQAQESNNPSRISSANSGLTVSGGPTVNTSGLKSTAPEKTNKDFSAQQACNIEGGTWNGNTCTCPEENEGWDSTRQICSVDAKLTTLTTDTSAPDAVNAADVKIKGPTNTTSKKDLDKNQKALNKELKEQDCANKNGRWDGVTCWCGAKVQSLDEKATACPTKEEKQAAKAQTKLEKDFVADVKNLTDAFNKKVKALTKDKK